MTSIGLALGVLCGAAMAQVAPTGPMPSPSEALRLRSLAATCAQCHGTDGRASDGAELPGLAGRPASTMVEQLKALRSGARAGTVMPQLARGFDDAQIDRLAAYFAAVAAAGAAK